MEKFFLIRILFLVIIFHNNKKVLSFMAPPKTLKNIEILYISPFEISSEKPLITSNNIFFVNNNKLKTIDLEDIYSGKNNEPYTILGDTSKSPLGYVRTNKSSNIFLSEGNKLEMWEENTFNKFENKPIYEEIFDQFKCDGNDDSLKIGFCHQYDKNNYEIAIYNKGSKNIIVLDLLKMDKKISKENILAEFEMENNIAQSIIYYSYDLDKILKTKLMVIDQKGNIKIWSIGTFTENFGKTYYRYVNPLSNSFQTNETCPELLYNQDICGLIGPNKNIIFYMGEKHFTVIHLERGHFYLELFKISNPIPNSLTVLVLDDGDALIGTKDGYIYLIEYEVDNKNKKINILDKYNICDGSPVKHISYDISCPKNSEKCYVFAVNCGKLKVFRIGTPKNIIVKYRKIISIIILIGLIILFIFVYRNRKKSPKDKKEEEIELTEN